MSSFTGQELADFLYYKKIPPLYRNADSEVTEKQDLYRYLQSVIQGAFNGTLEQIAALTDLVNPQSCPVEYLPYLYQSFGFPYFEDIGEYYNRRFLASVGELLRRRGTIGGVRYLVRVLTGMESDISYERLTEGTIIGRVLNVFPRFPDVTSLAEIEVTTYTIKRFLELYLPFYIRVNFFPFIEIQHLDTDIYNNVSFANVLTQYILKERERILGITLNRNVAFCNINKYNFAEEKNNFIVLGTRNLSPVNTEILSYDLTKIKGKKLQIGNWVTNEDYRLRIYYSYEVFIDSIYKITDLYKDKVQKLQISLNRGTGMLIRAENDLSFERENNLSIKKVKSSRYVKNNSYDLTGLKGKKLSSPETIKLKYQQKINCAKEELVTIVSQQDLTFVDGKVLSADYYDVYNHNYNLKIPYIRLTYGMESTKYNLIPEEDRIYKLNCVVNYGNINYSIISYDLKECGRRD